MKTYILVALVLCAVCAVVQADNMEEEEGLVESLRSLLRKLEAREMEQKRDYLKEALSLHEKRRVCLSDFDCRGGQRCDRISGDCW